MPKEEKTVDIDTTGPGAEVDISEEKKQEPQIEVQDEKITQDDTKSDDAPEKSSEQLDVRDSKDDEKQKDVQETSEKGSDKPESKTEPLEEYSEGVKKRIAKLTKKWREAERQREAALDYAKGVQVEHSHLRNRFSRLEPDYVKAL